MMSDSSQFHTTQVKIFQSISKVRTSVVLFLFEVIIVK